MKMNRDIIIPDSEDHWKELRRADITSTQAAVLFGVSPYDSVFSLWHKKRGNIEDAVEENTRMRWGKILQDAIAHGIADENGMLIRSMTEYARLPEARVGASFDYQIEAPSPAILEVKNVDSLAFRNGWAETDYGLEAPSHIEVQLQVQLGVSGLREGYIAAFVGGNRVELLRREFDEMVWQRILDLAAWFWSLKEPPAPDYARDYEVISRLHGYSSAGKVIEATSEVEALMSRYKIVADECSAMEKGKKALKAQLLEKIGDAERVEGLSYNLSAKMIGDAEISAYTRRGYRDFRISERKS
jgi:putative phage-type endonuclease